MENRNNHRHAEAALKSRATPAAAARQKTFFKTGKGEYSEHDRFMGVTVPVIRTVAKEFHGLDLGSLERLLQSPYNETRLLSLLILGERYKRGGDEDRVRICKLYLKNAGRVNNWNLVDASAHYILGAHLLSSPASFPLSPRTSRAGEGRGEGGGAAARKFRSLTLASLPPHPGPLPPRAKRRAGERGKKGGRGDSRDILYKLAKSKNLWERRIAVVSTYAFIREGDFVDILKLSALLLTDPHDLMHKACGWMLREVGKKDVRALEKFLNQHHPKMPRTMLRYAIERFPEKKRKAYLKIRL